jgi:hypothetical protein
VWTILFPQGEYPDAQMAEHLGSLNWTVTLVYDRLSEAYTRTLVDEETPMPFLLLHTNEGRVLFRSAWKADVVPALTAALDEAFGDASFPVPSAEPAKRR